MIFELEGIIEKVFPPVRGIDNGRTWIRRDYTVRPKNMSTPIAFSHWGNNFRFKVGEIVHIDFTLKCKINNGKPWTPNPVAKGIYRLSQNKAA